MRRLAKWPPVTVMELLKCTNRCVNSSLLVKIIQNTIRPNVSQMLPKDPPSAAAVLLTNLQLKLLQPLVQSFTERKIISSHFSANYQINQYLLWNAILFPSRQSKLPFENLVIWGKFLQTQLQIVMRFFQTRTTSIIWLIWI